jgi:hypothetical protein
MRKAARRSALRLRARQGSASRSVSTRGSATSNIIATPRLTNANRCRASSNLERAGHRALVAFQPTKAGHVHHFGSWASPLCSGVGDSRTRGRAQRAKGIGLRMKTRKKFVTATVLLLSAIGVSACASCDHAAIVHPGVPAAGWPSLKTCNADSQCTGASPVCTAWETRPGLKCNRTLGLCMLKLAGSAQCAEGHVRAALLGSSQAVMTCDKTTCDFVGPVSCGTAVGAPCCVGGCNAGLVCNSFMAEEGAKCITPTG